MVALLQPSSQRRVRGGVGSCDLIHRSGRIPSFLLVMETSPDDLLDEQIEKKFSSPFLVCLRFFVFNGISSGSC